MTPTLVVRLATGTALHLREQGEPVTVCGRRLGDARVVTEAEATCLRCLGTERELELCALACRLCGSEHVMGLPGDAPARETLAALSCLSCGAAGLRFRRPGPADAG